MTKAQKLASQRNFAKYRLRGMLAALKVLQHEDFMRPAEKAWLNNAAHSIESLLLTWNASRGR